MRAEKMAEAVSERMLTTASSLRAPVSARMSIRVRESRNVVCFKIWV